MLKTLTDLPLRLARFVGRRIQEDDAQAQAEAAAREAANQKTVIKDTIPDHELAELPPEQLARTSESLLGKDVYFLDVRATELYRGGHLPGALHMPLVDVMIRLAELPPEGLLVCYDDTGDDGLKAALFLRRRGFDEAMFLDGGLAGWTDAGGPLEKG
jgi:rhodanese-related sulfurtransferase